MKSLKLSVCFISLFFLLPCFLSAQTPLKPEENDWRILLEAQNSFDNHEYSQSLQFALDAKKIRSQQKTWESYIITESLRPAAVRRVGDSISNILPVLKSRNEAIALDIINKIFEKKTEDDFNNSMTSLVAFISDSKVYPEADYICGQVYENEGEYELAIQFYDEAVKNSSFLDIQDVKYDILYRMADIAYKQQNNEDYEKYLLSILSDDKDYFQNITFKNAILRTIDLKTDKEPLEKFILLYRVNNKYFYKAYTLLSDFYIENNQMDMAIFTSALSCLTSFTRMYAIIKMRTPEYVYRNLADFFNTISLYEDVEKWSIENNIWIQFINFADLAKKRGDFLFASQLLTVLEESAPEQYWKNRASVLKEALYQ